LSIELFPFLLYYPPIHTLEIDHPVFPQTMCVKHTGMEETTFKGCHEEKGDRPLFFREEGQFLSSLTKGLKGTVPEKKGPVPFFFLSLLISFDIT
jgi:hypothetical protein